MDGNGKWSDTADTTVLVVDDTAAGRYAMGALLRRAGHQVVAVASGNEALAELDVRLRKGMLPDVALIDVHLPDMSGVELCRRLKARPHMAGLPVVHFSAGAVTPGDRCDGLDAGGEAYLSVPAEPEEIDAVLRAAVRAARLRADDQALARRLTRLSETIFTIQAARSLQELADAAAEGCARLTGQPAAVFFLGPDDELYRATSATAPRSPCRTRAPTGSWRVCSGASPVGRAGCRSPPCPRRCGPSGSSGRASSTTRAWC